MKCFNCRQKKKTKVYENKGLTHYIRLCLDCERLASPIPKRPPRDPNKTSRVVELRHKGLTFKAIGQKMEAEGFRSRMGKSLHPVTVKRIYDKAGVDPPTCSRCSNIPWECYCDDGPMLQ